MYMLTHSCMGGYAIQGNQLQGEGGIRQGIRESKRKEMHYQASHSFVQSSANCFDLLDFFREGLQHYNFSKQPN